jgi:hypothetical protein
MVVHQRDKNGKQLQHLNITNQRGPLHHFKIRHASKTCIPQSHRLSRHMEHEVEILEFSATDHTCSPEFGKCAWHLFAIAILSYIWSYRYIWIC